MGDLLDTPDGSPPEPEKRPVWPALKRGMRNRCPACGEGPILFGYTEVHASCPACGEELHHHRADDFPQYVTIFLVAHLLAAALLFVDDFWPNLPMSVHYWVWPALVVVLSLLILPVAKSALIAYQWALRMHGFETAHGAERPSRPETASREIAQGDPRAPDRIQVLDSGAATHMVHGARALRRR